MSTEARVPGTRSREPVPTSEIEPLLPSSADIAPTDVSAARRGVQGSDEALRMSRTRMSGLDLRPTKRDGTGLNLVYVGVCQALIDRCRQGSNC